MAAVTLPSNPTNGQTFEVGSTTYTYNSTLGVWDSESPASGGSGTTVYATLAELPLSGNDAGSQAYVSENNRLYIWNGSGWYNIALINTAPTITSGPNASYELAADGTPIVLTLTAQDPEGVPITWSYAVTAGSLGNTATVSQADNVFTITPSTSDTDAGSFSITFTASDGVNLATAASTFTLAFGTADAYYNLSSTLIKTGSTAGLTNATFVDESTNGFTVTRTGDVYQGSYSPYSPAGWSGYFDGTDDRLTLSSSAAQFGSGDFTVEAWIYPITLSSGKALIDFRSTTAATWGQIYLNTDNTLHFWLPTPDVGTTNTVTLNSWNHIVVTRVSNVLKMFINGVEGYSGSQTFTANASNITIGHGIDGLPSTAGFTGYISDVRFITGTAVYTSNFTPPTSKLTAITGTSLLTLQDSWFKDNSTNNFTITRYGNAKSVPNSPYLPSEQYDPVVHGGSMYFDNTGDELSIPNDAGFQFGTGDFTIELWVYYASSADVNGTLIGLNTASVGNWAIIGSGGLLYFQNGNASSSLMYPYTPPFGQWAHIAWTRSGSINRAFINGVQVSGDVSSPTNYNGTGTLTIGNGVTYATHQGYIADVRVVKGTAVYTSNFTPPTQPLTAISGTSLLIRGANAGVYDEMGKNNLSLIGNATTSTTVTKYNTTSMYFDGNSDYVSFPNSESVYFGTANFTIESWVYPIAYSSTYIYPAWFSNSPNDGGTSGEIVYYLNHPAGGGRIYVNGNAQISSPIATGQWSHLALVRNGNNLYFYINGTQAGTTPYSASLGLTTGNFTIGARTGNLSQTCLNGYIEDFRLTKGYARYTANFTPPTAPLGFSNAE